MSLSYTTPTRVIDSRHPSFLSSLTDWELWRMCYSGGDGFRNKYLERFTTREDEPDFQIRKRLTPIPSFAKAAINDIRNSIFQRMRDITRIGGSQSYRDAVSGEALGVDNRGSSMNAFLGKKVLEELLIMGRIGLYVDNPVLDGQSLADTLGARPYLYAYQIEDILSWTATSPESPSDFRSILVRDTVLDYDRRTLLPMQTFQRFRLMWIDPDTNKVMLQFYSMAGNEIDRNGDPGGPIALELTRIPFIMLDIGDSIIKDVANHQIALLNLTSRDVWYALQSNFPFYIEQRDLRAIGGHLKQIATADGTATTGGQGAEDSNIDVGAQHGRAYDKGANPPSFIHPSSEPLKASIQLQEKLEADIRRLVNLAVQAAGSRASAESKQLDNAGLEAGLSFIGLVLESAERQITQYWAAYENRIVSQREIATIKYPDRYSLKTDADRIKEASDLAKLMFSLPGRKVKREFAKLIVNVLLGGKVEVGVIDAISKEIDTTKYLTSDPNTIIQAVEAGLVGEQTGSIALGFEDNEYLQARADHADRVARIMANQANNVPGPDVVRGSKQALRSIKGDTPPTADPMANPAARGAGDLAATQGGGKTEKAAANNTDLRGSKKNRQRGKAAAAPVTGA